MRQLKKFRWALPLGLCLLAAGLFTGCADYGYYGYGYGTPGYADYGPSYGYYGPDYCYYGPAFYGGFWGGDWDDFHHHHGDFDRFEHRGFEGHREFHGGFAGRGGHGFA